MTVFLVFYISLWHTFLQNPSDTHKDVLHISVEAEGRVDFAESAKTLTKLAKSKLGVTPKFAVVPIGTLSRSEKKTKRVEDQRDL